MADTREGTHPRIGGYRCRDDFTLRVTDIGRQEVAIKATFSERVATSSKEEPAAEPEETADEQSFDRHMAGPRDTRVIAVAGASETIKPSPP